VFLPVYIDKIVSEKGKEKMSHFTVAVFTESEYQSVDDLLEPFSEHLEVEPYVSITRDDLIQRARANMQAIFEAQYQEWKEDPTAYEKGKNVQHMEYLKALPTLMERTDEEIYRDEVDTYNEERIDENGDIISTYNPDSKWDWYVIGGRWKGMLVLKPGKLGQRGRPGLLTKMTDNCDSAYVADVDFHRMRQQILQELRPYEQAMTKGNYKEEYMRERYPTEREYMQRNSSFYTFAVLTPDGTWHAPGEMGWFGMSSAATETEREWEDTYYDRFIKPAIEKGWYMTIVDCHI